MVLHPARRLPERGVAYLQVLAAYAVGPALNGVLPANIGTAVMLLMFVAIIPGANLPGVLGGMVVQKIFFTVAGAFVYAYLFLSVPGSFDLQLPALHDPRLLALGIVAGAAMLLVVLGRKFWRSSRGYGPRPCRAARSSPGAASTCSRWRCRRSARRWPARRDRHVLRRLWHNHQLPLGDLGVGRQLDGDTVSVTPGGVGVDRPRTSFRSTA